MNSGNLKDNELQVTAVDADQRLDKFLLKYLNTAGKSFVYKMLRKKRIKLNGARAEGSEVLREGDILTFYIARETLEGMQEQKAINESLGGINVIYEDSDILIADKPMNLLSHSETANDDNMVDRVRLYLHREGEFMPAKDSTFAPSAINRLDRNTSGLMLFAKNAPAARELSAAVAERRIIKKYLAVALGQIDEKMQLDFSLEKDTESNTVRVSDDGKASLTELEPLSHHTLDGHALTLLLITLHTGRTHQIRAHLAQINHPILGDIKYGDFAANAHFRRHGVRRPLLHAYQLQFQGLKKLTQLNGKSFTSEPPQDFKSLGIQSKTI